MCIYVYIHILYSLYIYIYIWTWLSMCTSRSVYMYMSMYVCRFIYICAVLSCFSVLNFLQIYGPQSSRLLCPWDSPGKNTEVGCHFLLQGIFPTQGWNLCLLRLLHWQVGSLPLATLRESFYKHTIVVLKTYTFWVCAIFFPLSGLRSS